MNQVFEASLVGETCPRAACSPAAVLESAVHHFAADTVFEHLNIMANASVEIPLCFSWRSRWLWKTAGLYDPSVGSSAANRRIVQVPEALGSRKAVCTYKVHTG